MEKNIKYVEELYREILYYATNTNYNINPDELEELAYKAGYTKQELIQLIKDIYESLPIAFPYRPGENSD